MIESLRNRMECEEGFTLIELLVVILIIGILAAIAIPSFLNQREKGQDTCAKSALRTMATAMETFYTDHNNYTATIGDLNTIESSVTDAPCGPTSQALALPGACSGGAVGYCMGVQSATTTWFLYDREADGSTERRCGFTAGRVGKGGCPSDAHW